ncbi:cation diffusion facilitator family transporter [Uliginosibacterium gangwonense]|uniref:cation diffusion facilitator family transporter n=1 Tax=Uliginosibacterium gangwonense TaxID=392736 RepID=UPI00037DCD92|nr:cation diffusion facilitator family transporter [Uliginosibacterium gangwonense]
MNRKSRVALLSVGSNTLLIILKLIVGLLSGSVSIISEAIHSTMDLAAAVIAFFSVRVSDLPPDADHPYGHEKWENVSGVIEGALIVIAAGWIIYEAAHKLLAASPIESVGLGFGVMAISALVNALVSARLYKIAREEQSIALEADALHLKADVYTSLGVAGGLGLIWITGWTILDPIVAILVAIFILREAFSLINNAFLPLIDTSLPEAELEIVRKVVSHYADEVLDLHDLRSRRSGKTRHIDMHLIMHRSRTLEQAHALCDRIEAEISIQLDHAKVLIHPECCASTCLCTPSQAQLQA